MTSSFYSSFVVCDGYNVHTVALSIDDATDCSKPSKRRMLRAARSRMMTMMMFLGTVVVMMMATSMSRDGGAAMMVEGTSFSLPLPDPYVIELPNGQLVQARMVGTAEDPEEEDLDGFTIVPGDGNSNRTDYFYAKVDPVTEDLIPTNIRATDRARRPKNLPKHARRGTKAKERMRSNLIGFNSETNNEDAGFNPNEISKRIKGTGGGGGIGSGRGGNGFQGRGGARAGVSFGGSDNDMDGLGDRALRHNTVDTKAKTTSNHVRRASSTETEEEEEEETSVASGSILHHTYNPPQEQRQLQTMTLRTEDGNSKWTGTKHMLIVLMRFSDHVGRTLPTPADYEAFFNSEGPNDPYITPSGSIKKFFKRASYDQLNLHTTVTPVWITLPNTERYYAHNGQSGLTTRIHEAMKYALEYIVDNNLITNWADFENGVGPDATAELVGFLHSGYGAEWPGNTLDGANYRDRIWTHNSELGSFVHPPNYGPSTGFHKVEPEAQYYFIRVLPYFIATGLHGFSRSNICRIGAIAHNIGNQMGLTDLVENNNGNGVGYWSIMGSSWGFRSQKCVSTLDPYSKIKMGWLNPNNITTIEASGRVALPASLFSSEGVVKISRGFPSDDEYLLVEYRKPTPDDSEYCLTEYGGGGLAIWHIDESVATELGNQGYPGQEGWPTNGNHYKVALMQSDGKYDLEKNATWGDSTDLWRSGQTFGPSTRASSTTPVYPNSDSYKNGVIQPTDIFIGNITESVDGSAIEFDVSVPGGTLVSELRFSQKIALFNDNISQAFDTQLQANYLPLGPNDYPLVQPLGDLLKETKCGSVVLQDDYNVGTYDIGALTELAGGPPTHAGDADGINSTYWMYLEEVIDYQLHRRQAVDPTSRSSLRAMSDEGMPWLSLPNLWTDFSIEDVAEAVHDEYPGYHQARLLEKLGAKPDIDIIPRRCRQQFLRSIVLYSQMNTWSIDTVGPKNFAAKYYNGRARPEEAAWAVHCSLPTLTMEQMKKCDKSLRLNLDIVPQSIQTKVAQLNLTHMENFGSYPEGSPRHPAWPAMHSAASVMSVWLPIVANLTDTQVEQVKKTDLAVAMARTVAGVHYYDDNIAGLKMGQYIIEKELPNYLKETYDADPVKVQEKINKKHFDWEAEAARILGTTPFASSASR